MKYSLSLCVVLLVTLFCQNSSAGTITVHDSTYADSIYLYPFGTDKVVTPENAFGVPDSQYAHMGPLGLGPLLDLMFTHTDGVTALTMQKNAKISIWGKKDASVDTSAAQVKFVKTDPDGVILYESQIYILEDGLNVITLGDKDYTFMEFTLTGTEFQPGSKGYLIDAVQLVQDRDSATGGGSVSRSAIANASRVVSSYPNPFISTSQQPTVIVHVATPGDAELKIFDALGREILVSSLGYVGAGDYLVPVTLTEPQVYFARLFVGNIPSGPAYRLLAQ